MTATHAAPLQHRRMRRMLAVAASAAVVVALLSACVGIPSTGAVIVGNEVSQQEPGGTEFVVDGPSTGDSREQILRGFINAFKSSGDYEVARQFLSSSFVNDWDPRESVLVHSGQTRFVAVDESSMQYVISAIGSVTPSGIYSAFASSPSTLSFTFVQEDGEWRIGSAPNGIVLSTSAFEAIFGQHVLFFLDPSSTLLVPDLRWFPSGATAATRIVSALLAGPPEWLQGAVATAFPDGTQLTSPKRVAVDGTVAQVDLTVEALAATPQQRQLMRLQLESSLVKVASISSVVITVSDAPFDVGDPGPGLPQARPQVDNRSLIMGEEGFGFYANGTIARIDGISDTVEALNPVGATLGAGGTVAAVLSADGVSVVRKDSAARTLDTRPGLIEPSLDGFGYVWSVPASSPAAITAFAFDGAAHAVATPLPSDATIVSLELSRDGTRIAILLSTPTGPRLIVSAVLRDPNDKQAPISLGEPVLDTAEVQGNALDATWLDETAVATLVRSGDITTVHSHLVGGRRSSLGTANKAVQIVGGNGEAGLRILDADGKISARRGSGWQETTVSAQFIAKQR